VFGIETFKDPCGGANTIIVGAVTHRNTAA
jgi:hypothetical protein